MRVEIDDENVKAAFDEAWERLPESVRNLLESRLDFVQDRMKRWDDPKLLNHIAACILTPDKRECIAVFDDPPTLDRRLWVGLFAEELGHALDTAIRDWKIVDADPHNELVARFYALAWGFVDELAFIEGWRRLQLPDYPHHDKMNAFWSILLTAWHNNWTTLCEPPT